MGETRLTLTPQHPPRPELDALFERAKGHKMTQEERNLYHLIARGYLAQFYPVHTYDQTKAKGFIDIFRLERSTPDWSPFTFTLRL